MTKDEGFLLGCISLVALVWALCTRYVFKLSDDLNKRLEKLAKGD